MSGNKKMIPQRWLALTLALLLIALASHAGGTLASAPRGAYGAIPLDNYAVEFLPPKYDARVLGLVTSVKDQGECNAGWAFASVGALEGHMVQAGYALRSLSVQQLLSCNTFGYDCDGGSADAARFWETQGPVPEYNFPYSADDAIPCSAADEYPRINLRLMNWRTLVNDDEFKASVYNQGPGCLEFDMYSDFQEYLGAPQVYVNQSGATFVGRHAVTIVGWDDDAGYYVCKNSWGTSWGLSGYVLIAYQGHSNDLHFTRTNFDAAPNQPPVADAGGPYSGHAGVLVHFDGTGSSDPNGDALTYTWDFGDGQSGTGATPSHSYSDYGTYAVCLVAQDTDGLDCEDCTTAEIDFAFDGFFPPVDNLPVENVANAGRSIPIKFSLGGDQGLNILDGVPQVQLASCSPAPTDIIDTYAQGSGLSYDPQTQQYNYVWKTQKAWAGKCGTLTIRLVDGSSHQALFKFK